MKTMSHSPENRKLWHEGKRKTQRLSHRIETKSEWFHRVLVRAENLRGAYTPPRMKRGITYKP